MKMWAKSLRQGVAGCKASLCCKPSGVGHMRGLGVVCIVLSLYAPATAQITPFDIVGGYRIAQVDAAKVCLASANLISKNKLDMNVSFYRTTTGQRWQVVGYLSEFDHIAETDTLKILFDDRLQLTRDVEFRGGDYMIPFERLQEVQNFEAEIQTSDTLTLALKEDEVNLSLADLRPALARLQNCLQAFD